MAGYSMREDGVSVLTVTLDASKEVVCNAYADVAGQPQQKSHTIHVVGESGM